MPRVIIPVQELTENAQVDASITFTAGDASNNHYFLNTGREVLIMQSSAGGKTATITSVADEDGRTGDLTLAPAAGIIGAAGFFNPSLFSQGGSGDLNKVFVELDADTGVSFAVVRPAK